MAQNVVDFSDNPTGSGLMDDYLAKDQQNVLTSNSGIQRPSYAVAGTKWLDTSVTPWLWKMYDGSSDITLGTVNPSTHLFTPAGILPSQEGQSGKFLQTNGTSTVWTDAVDYTNITNCLTAIPQDIKLELNNGTLTLKAGSKVYIPNGVGKFDEVVVSVDREYEYTAENSTRLLMYDSDEYYLYSAPSTNCYSGTSAPTSTSSTAYWYDTTNNQLKKTTNSGSTWISNKGSLPFAVITVSGGKITSIDQVLNGFGYIGSTGFILPGIEELIPNGKNDDLSLNNIKFKTSSVMTFDTSNNVFNVAILLSNNTLALSESRFYFEQEDKPSKGAGWWYKPSENKCYVISGGDWVETTIPFIKIIEYSKDSTGRITSFKPKTVFRAADYYDTVRINDAQAVIGRKTFTDTPISNGDLWFVDTTGEAPDNPPSQNTAYGTLRWIVKGTEGSTAVYGGGQELFRIQPIIGPEGRFFVSTSYLYGTNKPSIFSFGCNADGSNPYFNVPTPGTTSNSTNAATTAWVNNFITNMSSTVGSGYMYIGNLLIQWGTIGRTTTNGTIWVGFPKPFANTAYGLSVSEKADDSENHGNRKLTINKTLSTTGFRVTNDGWTNSYVGITGSWLAIGQRG